MPLLEETKTFISFSRRWAIWDVESFSEITTNELRKKKLSGTKNIERLIKTRALIPIIDPAPVDNLLGNSLRIKSKINFSFKPFKLKKQEEMYLIDSSQSYLLNSSGFIAISAFEDIYNFVVNASSFLVPAGHYECRIYKIDSLTEHESRKAFERRNMPPLPDIVVHLVPESKTRQIIYRQSRITFNTMFP